MIAATDAQWIVAAMVILLSLALLYTIGKGGGT